LLEAAPDGMVVVNQDGEIVLLNARAEKQFGYRRDELLGQKVTNIIPEGFAERLIADALRTTAEALEQQIGTGIELCGLRKGGSEFPIEIMLSPLESAEGILVTAAIRDITERKVAEERIRFLAYYDALTGLPNRTLLQDRLTKALASALRRKEKVALLFLDLDRFKDINDSFGHSVGDLLLQNVAERFKSGVRKQDTVGRLGGDEFLIVLTNVKEIANASVAAERFMHAMSAKFVIQGRSLSISCSIGISMFPEDGMDGESLLRNADAAMYSAKDSGRNNFRFFTEDMNAQAVERVTLENDLRQALDKNELFLVYQPQMNIVTGKIIGLEALLRWQHPTLGLMPPDRFIRIAENCGLIIPIGEWVLRTACAQVRKWQDEGIPAVSIAINVSTVQFRQKGFCELIRRVVNEMGLDPQYLQLELTESIFLDDADETLSLIQKLKAMGLTLAIDDFGTGYSNFNYLRQFRISKLKIDRSFIRDVAVNPDYVAITTAIISMAKSLNIKVLAEGVEDEAQMSFLRAHQCDEIQGYYFSKPLAVDKVAAKLRGHTPEPHV
jgi:diguanylate cyclase (GGDEF)-like protein/PAS domain S-box-containing protein